MTRFMDLLTPTDWMEYASCQEEDPETFFPKRSALADGIKRAKDICRSCPVKTQCLDYALEHRIEHGIWAGTSASERIIIRRKKSQ